MPSTGANTPIHYRGLFGRSYSGPGSGSDEGSQSPTSPSPRSRSSSSAGTRKAGLFGFTPINGEDAKKSSLPPFHATVDLIKEEHFKAAGESVQDPEIREELEEEIERDCEWLRSFLYAAKVRFK